MARKNFLIDGLFGFEGRLRRSEYWIASIGLGVVRFVVLMVAWAFALTHQRMDAKSLPVRLGIDLLFLWPSAAIVVKRGHDRNRSTAYSGVVLAVLYGLSTAYSILVTRGRMTEAMLCSLVVLVGAIYMLIDYGIIDGTKGPNRYGPSPKGHQGVGVEVAKAFG
jgi:uncharacterized membrane protein YhaH (DUF805 family)